MLIGLTGKKLAGKDTAGAYLVRQYDFTRLAFADKLRDGSSALLDIPYERVNEYKDAYNLAPFYRVQIVSPRGDVVRSFTWTQFLQRFGTQMGRNIFGSDFWVNQCIPDYGFIQSRNIVVTDVRFENEARKIKELGVPGIIIEIQRPELDDNDPHESEAGIPRELINATIRNSGSIADLQMALDQTIRRFRADN